MQRDKTSEGWKFVKNDVVLTEQHGQTMDNMKNDGFLCSAFVQLLQRFSFLYFHHRHSRQCKCGELKTRTFSGFDPLLGFALEAQRCYGGPGRFLQVGLRIRKITLMASKKGR